VAVKTNDLVFLTYDEKVYSATHMGNGVITEPVRIPLTEPVKIICAGSNISFAVTYTNQVFMWHPFDPTNIK